MSAWNEKRARALLKAAFDQAARGHGMSDRTLERIAALTQPEASQGPTAMRRALRQAGWSRPRIERAIRDVRRAAENPVGRFVRRNPRLVAGTATITAGAAACVAAHSAVPMMIVGVVLFSLWDSVEWR